MEKHVPTFDEFVSEGYQSAFDLKRRGNLKHIKFILDGWDHFDKNHGKDTFYFDWSDRSGKVDKEQIEKLIMDALNKEEKESPNDSLSKIKKEFLDSQYHTTVLALSNLKGNYSGLTYAFKALDDLYGTYGDGMGWIYTK